jgi:FKBP-type peptidyl-prolyl cis-trans isomerase FkpA
VSNSAVPIHPIKKGSLVRLWVGLGVLVLGSGAFAYWGTMGPVASGCSKSNLSGKGKIEALPSGVLIQTLVAGKGASPKETDITLLNYKGKLKDGKQFDSGQQTPFPVTGTIKGFSLALMKMAKGGSYEVCIPSSLAYGPKSPDETKIPNNAALIFDIDLLDYQDRAVIEQMQQQMQAQQGGAPGGPGGLQGGPGEPPQGPGGR